MMVKHELLRLGEVLSLLKSGEWQIPKYEELEPRGPTSQWLAVLSLVTLGLPVPQIVLSSNAAITGLRGADCASASWARSLRDIDVSGSLLNIDEAGCVVVDGANFCRTLCELFLWEKTWSSLGLFLTNRGKIQPGFVGQHPDWTLLIESGEMPVTQKIHRRASALHQARVPQEVLDQLSEILGRFSETLVPVATVTEWGSPGAAQRWAVSMSVASLKRTRSYRWDVDR